jgi:hypothetical protein
LQDEASANAEFQEIQNSEILVVFMITSSFGLVQPPAQVKQIWLAGRDVHAIVADAIVLKPGLINDLKRYRATRGPAGRNPRDWTKPHLTTSTAASTNSTAHKYKLY